MESVAQKYVRRSGEPFFLVMAFDLREGVRRAPEILVDHKPFAF